MIKLASVQIKEASRVYGDFAEKVAFDVNINPASVLGSIAGGYTASHVYNKKKDENDQAIHDQTRLENNSYSQVENVMRDLKIVFTPINVLYSVNGQVFEIIKADEMTPHMKRAFIQKDANYFKRILLNKIGMEIQLAEQAFAQRLLASGGYGPHAKQASYTAKQDFLLKTEEETFNGMVKSASEGLEEVSLKIQPSFDSLRPFEQAADFFHENTIEKVAGIFDLFQQNDKAPAQEVDLNRFNDEVNVGFLPDRVVFIWNGQVIEQMSLLNMNEKGYEAFRRKDKGFFLDLFQNHTKDINQSLHQETQQMNQTASEEPAETEEEPAETENEPEEKADDETPEETDKEAAALEDIADDVVEGSIPVPEREDIDIFAESDIHPAVYDKVLTEKYGVYWARLEIESILKQIELDFEVERLNEHAVNKISVLHAVAAEEHAMFLAPLSFEKFMRAVNSKSVVFEEFQGNLSFEEIMFGLEIAKSCGGDEVFLEFHEDIAPYIAEELQNAGVRFVSDQVFDESNPAEKTFFDSVNGFLLRKWKDTDSQGIVDSDEIDAENTVTLQIVEITEDILKGFAEYIDFQDPYQSVDRILEENELLAPVAEARRIGARNMVRDNVIAHFIAAIYIEYKYQELQYILAKLREEGVLRD